MAQINITRIAQYQKKSVNINENWIEYFIDISLSQIITIIIIATEKVRIKKEIRVIFK